LACGHCLGGGWKELKEIFRYLSVFQLVFLVAAILTILGVNIWNISQNVQKYQDSLGNPVVSSTFDLNLDFTTTPFQIVACPYSIIPTMNDSVSFSCYKPTGTWAVNCVSPNYPSATNLPNGCLRVNFPSLGNMSLVVNTFYGIKADNVILFASTDDVDTSQAFGSTVLHVAPST